MAVVGDLLTVLIVDTLRREGTEILGSPRSLNLDSLRYLAPEVRLSPSVTSGMPYPSCIAASPVYLETNMLQKLIRLIPVNLLPAARRKLEQCSRTA